MEARLSGTLRTIITGLVALVLVFILIKVVLWSLYSKNVFDYLDNDAEKLGFTYSSVSKDYKGTVDNKYDVTVKDPTKFNFNGYVQFSEKQGQVWKSSGGTNQVLLTLKISPDYKSDFKYSVVIDEITSSTSTRTSKGSVDFDPINMELLKDNTDAQNGGQYIDVYSIRIQEMIGSANTTFGQDIAS